MDKQEQTPRDVFTAWCDEQDEAIKTWWQREAERVLIEQMQDEAFMAMVEGAA